MRADYHTHHYRCGHATGNLADYVEAAIAVGLDEIGLSDHSPIYHLGADPHPLPGTAMSRPELPRYVQEAAAVRDRFAGRISVRLGVESDYVLGWDDHYRTLWQQYPLDYVIGSVHWLDRWSPLLEDTVRVLAECDVAIELNTSGWRKTCNDCYPRTELLARCCHWGVPVTLGSDAHAPGQVGHRFDAAVALLKDVGYREFATFAARRRRMVPLD